MSLIRQVSLCLHPECSTRNRTPTTSIQDMRLCWQRLFAEPQSLALEHFYLDCTRSTVAIFWFDLVSLPRSSGHCFVNRSSQLRIHVTEFKHPHYKLGYSSPLRFQELTVKGFAPTILTVEGTPLRAFNFLALLPISTFERRFDIQLSHRGPV